MRSDNSLQPPFSVLFVCTGNAGRSQMAQAMFGNMNANVVLESAGVEPWQDLHPMAVKIMAERGISMAKHHPKSVAQVALRQFDLVITIGDPALAKLPRGPFSSSFWQHWDIDDPADADGQPNSESVFLKTAEALAKRLSALEATIRRLPRMGQFARQPGLGTGLWGRERFLPAVHLPLIKAAGFRMIELNFFDGKSHFDWDDADAIRELRQVADDLGIAVWSIHSPDLKPLTSAIDSERQEQVDILKHCLDISSELGAKAVVSHALLIGSYDKDPKGAEERVQTALAGVHHHARGGTTTIGYENTPFVTAPDPVQTRNVLKRLEKLPRSTSGFVWDTGHANMYGDQEEIAKSVGDRLISWHLNDNPGDQDVHLVPGEGTADWKVVRRVMDTFRGPFIYELLARDFDPLERMTKSMAWHRKFVQTAK